jgi:hypothetical protein
VVRTTEKSWLHSRPGQQDFLFFSGPLGILENGYRRLFSRGQNVWGVRLLNRSRRTSRMSIDITPPFYMPFLACTWTTLHLFVTISATYTHKFLIQAITYLQRLPINRNTRIYIPHSCYVSMHTSKTYEVVLAFLQLGYVNPFPLSTQKKVGTLNLLSWGSIKPI